MDASQLLELPPRSRWLNTTTIYETGYFVDVGFSPVSIAVIVWASFTLCSYMTGPVIPYSKLANKDSWNKVAGEKYESLFDRQTPAKTAFSLVYLPALITYPALFGILSIFNFQQYGTFAPSPIYSLILLVLWVVHFAKRIFEVQCVHKFSGSMNSYLMVIIGSAYAFYGVQNLLFSNQVEGYSFGPDSDTFVTDVIALGIWGIGILGNLFFHLQLRWSRSRRVMKDDGKLSYLTPKEIGIFFHWFICPHYLAEGLEFIGYAMFSGTIGSYIVSATVVWYFVSRTFHTKAWYKAKGLLDGDVESIEAAEAREGEGEPEAEA